MLRRAVDGLDDRHAEREQDAERDRHVHVELRSRAAPASARAEERLARIGRAGSAISAESQWKKSRVSGAMSVRCPTTPTTDSSMMFIAAKPATRKALQQPLRARLLFGLDAALLERIGAIAGARERRDEPAASVRGLQTRRRRCVVRLSRAETTPAQACIEPLDVVEASRAVDARDGKIHVAAPSSAGRDVEREIDGVLRGVHHFTGASSMRLTERNSSDAPSRRLRSSRPIARAPIGADGLIAAGIHLRERDLHVAAAIGRMHEQRRECRARRHERRRHPSA